MIRTTIKEAAEIGVFVSIAFVLPLVVAVVIVGLAAMALTWLSGGCR